jgi:RNA polymerase sigma-70 factor (ECF subfamily)
MADLLDRLYRRLLVIRCQVGDRIAFEELVGLCQPRLRGFLRKLLPGGDHVDDVAQEVWMDVFGDLAGLRDPDAFLPWFYRIAHNRAFRVLRKHRWPMESLEEVNPADGGEDQPEFTPDDARAVHAALDQLPVEQREALMLRFMEEMSYEQIAIVAECNVGTVRSRIHYAKLGLRKIFKKTGEL